MNGGDFEVLTFADLRFAGGTSRAVLAEISAASRGGVVTGLCPVLGGAFASPRAAHPGFAAAVAAGGAVLCDASAPVSAGVVLIHHPSLFQHLPTVPLPVSAGAVVLVLHEPPFDGLGRTNYDLAHVVANAGEVFCAEILLAPVSAIVRQQLTSVPAGARLLPFDWHNLIDLDAWPWRGDARPAPDGPVIIGRHSRPSALKFPDTRDAALLCYPDRPDIRVRMLGVGDAVRAAYAPLPANWETLPFDTEDVRGFLQGLDVYVYAHASAWIEAFGYTVLEAMAIGVPAILPPYLAAVFGDAAVYAAPDRVVEQVLRLSAAPALYAAQSRRGRALAVRDHGLEGFLPRLALVRDVAGPRVATPPVRRTARPRRVVFATSNGVGLGHLTRAMAVARAMPAGTVPAILTMSQSFRLAAEAGFLTQFVPHFRVTGAEPGPWNQALALEVGDFLAAVRPDVLVYDGNVPYPGLRAALDDHPGVRRVWMRRELWQPDIVLGDDSSAFDLIIAPGEISSRFDTGPTGAAGDAIAVAPILAMRPEARLSRAEARAALKLDGGRMAVGVMLGAGTNYDMAGVRAELLRCLAARRDVDVVEFAAPLQGAAPAADTSGPRRVALYPAYACSCAFDAMITGAGYNSFHESILGGIPTLFVPNEAGEMDLQILRARHATRTGAGLMVRAWDRQAVQPAVTALLDPDRQAEMRRRMERLAQGRGDDGARAAAELIHALAFAVRAREAPHIG